MALMNFLKKVQKVAQTVSNVAEQVQKNTGTPARKEAPVPAGAPAPDCYSFRGTVDDYFFQLISGCFPQYRVYTNERMAGPGDIPVSFLLCQNGQPKLAVILCDSQEYRTRRVRNTVDACTARNIPVQRYYRQFRNKASYVVDRIRSAL